MAKTLSRSSASALTKHLLKQPHINGGSLSRVRLLSTNSGFPYLNLSSIPAQAHAHTANSHPASASTSAAYAQQFLAASGAKSPKAGSFTLASPRQKLGTNTAVAVDSAPLPTFPCEKSAITRLFDQQTATGRERAFFVSDVGVVERQYARWVKELPRVRPFYAVKCNPDATLLRVLASEGAGFDCASGEEMAACLSFGVPAEDIIFANPIKCTRDLQFAAEHGVKKMTFDNEAELYKIKEHCPEAELVLRLLADDSGSKMKFGVKFGAPSVQVEGLLRTAQALGLKVIGTSFHIGSGCFDVTSYEKAIKLSRSVFDLASALGMPKFTFLDLGGGFPGNPVPNQRTGETPAFEEFSAVIRDSLENHFPADMGVQIIGEPGRYMATAWSTLFVLVQGKREEPRLPDTPVDAKRKFLYYINDGVYGSFNCIMFDHATPVPVPAYRFMEDKVSLDRSRFQLPKVNPYLSMMPEAVTNALYTSALADAAATSERTAKAGLHTVFGRDRECQGTFFGPTCDSMDVVAKDFPCEELFVGDWLAFAHSGAYTNAAATTFNGMPKATAHYCRSRRTSPDA